MTFLSEKVFALAPPGVASEKIIKSPLFARLESLAASESPTTLEFPLIRSILERPGSWCRTPPGVSEDFIIPEQPRLSTLPLVLVGRIICLVSGSFPVLQCCDSSGNLPIFVVNCSPGLFGRLVFFPFWRCLENSPGEKFAEVDGQQAIIIPEYDETTEQTQALLEFPLLKFPISYDFQFSLERRSKRPRLLGEENSSTSSLVHVAGTVVSISPIISRGSNHPNSPTFFLEFSSFSQESSIFLVFTGKFSLIWYNFLQLGGKYIILNIKPSKLVYSNKKEIPCFLAQGEKAGKIMEIIKEIPKQGIWTQIVTYSAVNSGIPEGNHHDEVPMNIPVDSSQPSDFLPASSSFPDFSQPSPPLFSSSNDSLVSYTGVISHQIMFGVYEFLSPEKEIAAEFHTEEVESLGLPKPRLRLYLTHAPPPICYTGMGIRPGSVVRLHRAHCLFSGNRFLGFGLCAVGRLEVEKLSPLATTKPPGALASPALLEALSRVSLSEAALLVDCMARLKRKTGNLLKSRAFLSKLPGSSDFSGLLPRLLAERLNFSFSANLLDEFFDHSESCKIHQISQPAIVDSFFPALSGILKRPEIERSAASLLASANADIAWAGVLHEASDFLLPGMKILACFQCGAPTSDSLPGGFLPVNSGFLLSDGFGSIPCQVLGQVSPSDLNCWFEFPAAAIRLALEFLLILEARQRSARRLAAYFIVDLRLAQRLHSPEQKKIGNPAGIFRVRQKIIREQTEQQQIKQSASNTGKAQKEEKTKELDVNSAASPVATAFEFSLVGDYQSSSGVSFVCSFLTLRHERAKEFPLFNIGSAYRVSGLNTRPRSHAFPALPALRTSSKTAFELAPAHATAHNVQEVRDLLLIDMNSLDRGESLMASTATGVPLGIFSVRGVVLNKTFLPGESSRGPANTGVSILGRWKIKLRDTKFPHFLTLNCPLPGSNRSPQQLFPAGLLPGMEILVHGVQRILGPNCTLFLEAGKDSAIEILSASPEPTALPPHRLLFEFRTDLSILDQRLNRLHVRLSCVRSLKIHQDCHFGCPPGQRASCRDRGCPVEIRAQAKVAVDDGSGTANLFIDEERGIRALLQLSENQWEKLHDQVAQSGPINFDAAVKKFDRVQGKPEESNGTANSRLNSWIERHIATLQGHAYSLLALQFFPKSVQLQLLAQLERPSGDSLGPLGSMCEFFSHISPRPLVLGVAGSRRILTTYAPNAPICFKAIEIEPLDAERHVKLLMEQLEREEKKYEKPNFSDN